MTIQYCAQCGTKIEAGARFCIQCGAPQSGPKQQAHPTRSMAQPANRLSLPLLLLIFGGLLLLGGGAVYLFNYAEAAPAPVVNQANIVESDIPYPDVVRISLEDAKALHDAETAVFLDVRPLEDYEALHIPDALSMPLTELPARYAELDKDAAILTYCT